MSGEIRFSDVVRELDLSQGTAHAILKTLSDRGWVTRDPVTKAFTLGPALTLVASSLDIGRPLAQLARTCGSATGRYDGYGGIRPGTGR